MKILRAQKDDIDSVERIYENIHTAEEKGLTATGWIRNVYPTRKTAEDALSRNDLFVIKDNGKITATAIINQIQVAEYKNASWKHTVNENEVMVFHTLAVDPLEKGKGYGRAFVSFYENYARQNNCTSLRMDTNITNTVARSLYQKLGYDEIGIIESVFNGIPNVRLVCLEKYLG